MKVIAILIAVFAPAVPAAIQQLRSAAVTEMKTEATGALTNLSFKCPTKSFVSQVNGHLGAVLDRMNFRCNDFPAYTNSGDIGCPIGGCTSIKTPPIILPSNTKGITSVSVGYSYYAPYDQWVVAAARYCTVDTCYEQFSLGQTICSADVSKAYACPKIVTYSEVGKVFAGGDAVYMSQTKQSTNYISSFIPFFK